MVRVLRLFVVVVAALSVLTLAVPVSAATVAECQATVADLRGATQGVTFTGQNAAKDQSGLLGKLDSGATKLEQGKPADVLQALSQFRDKVATLQTQGKIANGDAETLIAGAGEAITCVQSLTA